ncbi:MAG TPA: hypothetical protein VHD76_01885 [Bryobacteraceae bacterium]|nr:hypothetical protein [Bryobacteraceae bacterium]
MKFGMRTRRRSPRQKSLLIVRCDLERLRQQGLALDDETLRTSLISAVGAGAQIEMVNGTDRGSLLRELGDLVSRRRVFDLVVVVGHANDSVIRLACDEFVFWKQFPEYLKPFQPRRIMLVACQAGCDPAPKFLFAALPRLQRIYASNLNVSLDLAKFMLLVLPYVLAARSPTREFVTMGKTLAFAFTGGSLREWRRRGITIDEVRFDGAVEFVARLLG